MESFWMGVPIVTRLGRGIIERQGAAFSRAVGLDAFVATDDASYVRLAVEWMSRPEELAAIRAGLRGRMLQSPLCDARAYVKAVEDKYRWMWARWLDEGNLQGR